MSLLVTVMMPAYNVEPFLTEAIESVLAQSFTGYEIVVCDDASSDGTWQVLQRYAEHPQIRLLQRSENGGPGRTRNEILRAARGEIIVLLDADDVLLPDTLERFTRLLAENPEVAVVYGDHVVQDIDLQGRALGPPQAYSQAGPHWDLMGCPFNNQGVAVRTALMRQCGGYDETLPCSEDWDFWLRAAEIARFHHLAGHFAALYRRRPNSLSRSVTAEQLRTCTRTIVERALLRRHGAKVCERAWQS